MHPVCVYAVARYCTVLCVYGRWTAWQLREHRQQHERQSAAEYDLWSTVELLYSPRAARGQNVYVPIPAAYRTSISTICVERPTASDIGRQCIK